MSKKCPRCGHRNSDERFFCQACSEPLDGDVRVIMDYEKMNKAAPQTTHTVYKQDEDDDYVPVKRAPAKKSHAGLWAVLICLVAAAGVAAWLLLSK